MQRCRWRRRPDAPPLVFAARREAGHHDAVLVRPTLVWRLLARRVVAECRLRFLRPRVVPLLGASVPRHL
eukprot:4008963-Prymnesium_polylepis.1